MSTDLELHQSQSYEPAAYATDPTGGRLVAWAEGLAAAHRIGSALCQTAFAPKHFQGKPAEAAAAILFGDEIGLSPTQALRSIYVISGTPSLYARQMVALVLHHGHDVWTVEKSDSKVTVAGKRRGSEHTITETWTVARAKQAGYTNNAKYNTDPASMLYARAASDVCRQIAPDALAGLAYTVEELEVMEPAPVVRVSRAKAEKPVMPEPDLEPPTLTADQPIPPDDLDLIDPRGKQMKALQAGMKDAGKGDRDDALAFLSAVLGRPVESSKTLTRAEAGKVLDELQFMAEGTPEEPTFDDAS